MTKERIFVAIDVGTTKVCTIVASQGPTGKLQILGTGLQPSQGLRKGSVINIPETRFAVRSSVQQAEEASGIRIKSALVGVTGNHIQCENKRITWDESPSKGPITRQDLERAVQATSRVAVAPTRELLHVIPRSYVLDGQTGIRNPIGMHALHLDVETHLVTGAMGPIENLVRSVEGASVKVHGLVLEPFASGEAILSRDEREVGVALIDIGGGTSDMAVFHQGAIWHTAIIPVGGYQLTNDLSIALGIPYAEAERLKVTYGHAIPEEMNDNEPVECIGFDGSTIKILKREISEILSDRCKELLHLTLHHAQEAGLDGLPLGGFVFTGGSATLPGLEQLARDIIPGHVRIGAPTNLDGNGDALERPAYATGVGTILWGMRHTTNPRRQSNSMSFTNRLRSLVLGMVRR